MLNINAKGKLYAKSQVADYSQRGMQLQDMNVIEFFTDTYEERTTSKKKRSEIPKTQADNASTTKRKPGRPCHERAAYLQDHPKQGELHRVMRSSGHNNLPNFIGKAFPWRDDRETHDFYCASMLMLLKPWRNLSIDLKERAESWQEAYDEYFTSAKVCRFSVVR